MRYHTRSETETLALAKRMVAHLSGGEVLLLQGELGAGKTTFVRGLARAFGIKERIKSPTFTLMRVYRIKNVKCKIKNFVHVDAYRVGARALIDIGLMDYIGQPDAIVIVEWGEKIKPLLKGRRYKVIEFQYGKNENERIIMQGTAI